MANTADIKRQINSISSTAKVTKAMQLISASKLKRSEQNFQNTKLFTETLNSILAEIAHTASSADNKLLQQKPHEKKVLLILMANNKGFVGSLTLKIAAKLQETIAEFVAKHSIVEIVGVKRKALILAKRLGHEVKYQFSDLTEMATGGELRPLISVITQGFSDDSYDAVYVLYPEYKSILEQEVVLEKLLPISLSKFKQEKKETDSEFPGAYTFDAETEGLLEKLLEEYLEISLITALQSSAASEYAARMLSMQKATDNAVKLSEEITLEYNKTRQAEITQQIQENINANLI